MNNIKVNVKDILVFNGIHVAMTKGKSYIVLDFYYEMDITWVVIISDRGNILHFGKDHFITPLEYRGNIINEILE